MTRIREWAVHRWARRRLSEYIDGALTTRARRRLKRHADECPDCGPTLRSLIRIVHALRTLPSLRRASVAPLVVSRLRAEAVEIPTRRARAFSMRRADRC